MPAPASAPPSAHATRPPVATIFAITLTGITVNTLISPVVPDILEGLDAPQSLAGLVIGAATLPGILLAPVIGLYADRFGRRRVLLPCLVLFAVAGGLGVLAPSVPVLVALRLLQGIGSAGLVNLAVVLIGDHWRGEDRSRLVGRNAAVLTLGLAVLPSVGGGLADLFGWRAAFAVYPLAAVTALIVARTLEGGDEQDVSFRGQVRAFRPVLADRGVIAVLVGSALSFALIFGLLLTVLPGYLASAFGLGAGARGILLSIGAIPNAALSLNLARLQHLAPRRWQLVAGTSLFAVGLATVAVAPSVPMIVVGLLVFGAGEGLLVPNLQDLSTALGPDESRGTLVASFVSAARLGQTVGPLAAGAGAAAFGTATVFGAGAGVALATGALLMVLGGRRGVDLDT